MEYKSKDLIKTVDDWNTITKVFPNLRLFGHPDLYKICKPIKRFDKKTLAEIKRLKRILARYRALTGFGKGIAAPQIGVLRRFLVVYKEDTPAVLINPEITQNSKTLTIAEELCMSMGILSAFVVRPKFVTVSYLDENKEKQEWQADILYSRVLQHEIDHLNGILYTDKAIKNGLRFVYNVEQFQGIKDYKK